MFIITGICLLIVKNINGNKDDYDITYKDAIIIGLIEGYLFVFIILLLLVLPFKNFDLFNVSPILSTKELTSSTCLNSILLKS